MTLGVTPASSVTTQLLFGQNAVFPTLSNAVPIGGLSQNTTDLSVASQLSLDIPTNVYKFNFEQGSAIKLGFTNQTGTTGLRVQVLDVTGNVVADSGGTTAQKAAFAQLNSSSGLAAGNGTYYVVVGYASGASPLDQSYNFQLYSGTTYNTSIVTSAQPQSYDPNLFLSATESVTPPSNLQLYTQTAVLPTSASTQNPINIGNLVSNGTELDGVSQITTANPADYYSFNFQQGSSIKLALSNTTNALLAVPLRTQLLNSAGKVIADNYGTDAQKQAYDYLTSGAGLQAANGQYLVKVTAAPGEPTTQPQTYNFQLLSGSSYGTIYKTTAQTPSPGAKDSAGSNVGVFASSEAQLLSRQGFNTIGEKASSAVNIGWLDENQTSLSVLSQLTEADSSDFYSFALQQGNSLKLAYTNNTNTSNLRVQLLNVSGGQVIADNHGTEAQQAAFAQLTSSTGLTANPANYKIKVSYANGANTTLPQTYNLNLYSGNSFNNDYETIASPQTYENAILSGNKAVTGYNPALAAESYLNSLSQGTTTNIFQTISTLLA